MIENEEFGDIVVRTGEDGAIVRLRDIARIELGARELCVQRELRRRTKRRCCRSTRRRARTPSQTANAVQAELQRLSATFPPGLNTRSSTMRRKFVRASVASIVQILVEAFLIVLLITYLFLQDWRATVVSALAIPVSLLGAMAILLVFGYSINTITLLALVLAIGLVVDDAILVVENVKHVMEEHPESTRRRPPARRWGRSPGRSSRRRSFCWPW